MKVSKSVSIDIELLQRTLEHYPNFSEAVSLALENCLFFHNETIKGNTVYFSRSYKTKIPKNIIWRLNKFENMTKWLKMLTKVEYLTEQKKGIGTRCKLYGKIGEREAVSIAEIIEYDEDNLLVYRAEGEFTVMSRTKIQSTGSSNTVNVMAMVGLSPDLSSPELNVEIYRNLDSAFSLFEKVASTFS
jgi:hypothetical protein